MKNRQRRESDSSAGARPIIIGDRTGREPACRTGEQAVEAMAETLERQRLQFQRLRQIIEKINRGQHLEEVLNFIYDEFRDVMPYNRIAFAGIDYEQELIVARWARSDKPQQIVEGYSRSFSETSLMDLARSGRPRIINDLKAYADGKTESETVQMLIEENLRSSLTCPLVVDGRPVGFLFFDSERPNAYTEAHAEFFTQMAGVVSVGVQRGLMFSQLAERNKTIEKQNRQLARQNERNQKEL
ncbi:MAG: GAF domain-containing protein, partial [Anaerolineaceae bacterium]|nr:GAF domain-containing protein [Anaerolineaceae bacterium]